MANAVTIDAKINDVLKEITIKEVNEIKSILRMDDINDNVTQNKIIAILKSVNTDDSKIDEIMKVLIDTHKCHIPTLIYSDYINEVHIYPDSKLNSDCGLTEARFNELSQPTKDLTAKLRGLFSVEDSDNVYIKIADDIEKAGSLGNYLLKNNQTPRYFWESLFCQNYTKEFQQGSASGVKKWNTILTGEEQQPPVCLPKNDKDKKQIFEPTANDLFKVNEYCSQGDNYANQYCQDWVEFLRKKPRISGEEGALDTALGTYCQKHPELKNCQCHYNVSKAVKELELTKFRDKRYCWLRSCDPLGTSKDPNDPNRTVDSSAYVPWEVVKYRDLSGKGNIDDGQGTQERSTMSGKACAPSRCFSIDDKGLDDKGLDAWTSGDDAWNELRKTEMLKSVAWCQEKINPEFLTPENIPDLNLRINIEDRVIGQQTNQPGTRSIRQEQRQQRQQNNVSQPPLQTPINPDIAIWGEEISTLEAEKSDPATTENRRKDIQTKIDRLKIRIANNSTTVSQTGSGQSQRQSQSQVQTGGGVDNNTNSWANYLVGPGRMPVENLRNLRGKSEAYGCPPGMNMTSVLPVEMSEPNHVSSEWSRYNRNTSNTMISTPFSKQKRGDLRNYVKKGDNYLPFQTISSPSLETKSQPRSNKNLISEPTTKKRERSEQYPCDLQTDEFRKKLQTNATYNLSARPMEKHVFSSNGQRQNQFGGGEFQEVANEFHGFPVPGVTGVKIYPTLASIVDTIRNELIVTEIIEPEQEIEQEVQEVVKKKSKTDSPDLTLIMPLGGLVACFCASLIGGALLYYKNKKGSCDDDDYIKKKYDLDNTTSKNTINYWKDICKKAAAAEAAATEAPAEAAATEAPAEAAATEAPAEAAEAQTATTNVFELPPKQTAIEIDLPQKQNARIEQVPVNDLNPHGVLNVQVQRGQQKPVPPPTSAPPKKLEIDDDDELEGGALDQGFDLGKLTYQSSKYLSIIGIIGGLGAFAAHFLLEQTNIQENQETNISMKSLGALLLTFGLIGLLSQGLFNRGLIYAPYTALIGLLAGVLGGILHLYWSYYQDQDQNQDQDQVFTYQVSKYLGMLSLFTLMGHHILGIFLVGRV